MTKAVVLLSGGLDSCTVASMALAQGKEVHALSFDYGQRHDRELQSAKAIVEKLNLASHHHIRVGLDQIGGSALTADIDVPDAPPADQIGTEIPVTYVPARNTVFLSIALGLAEVIGATEIHIGANAMDYSGYPDCRPEFFSAFEHLAEVATKQGVENAAPRVHAPLLRMTKAQIMEAAEKVQAPLDLTWSCYRGGDESCGTCESCVLRLKGFHEAGMRDPLSYSVGEDRPDAQDRPYGVPA